MNTSKEEKTALPDALLSKLAEGIQQVNSPEQSLLHSVTNIEERYIDREPLAEGAMKAILKCKDTVTGRYVALAFPKNTEEKESVELFLREARALTNLDHPNIIPVYDIGQDSDEKPYFTMKLIQGESLEASLKKYSERNDNDLAARLRIFERICEAMAFAHSKGVVHLDLKPDNIQISRYGEVQVCDWGLAKLMQDVTDTSSILLDDESLNFAEASLSMVKEGTRGTPGYMAPEQIGETHHEHNRQTDIYSLGAILYSLLTLKKPAEGSIDEILQKTKQGKIISPEEHNPECAGSLSAICMKALSLDPKERYQKVDDLLKDLHAYMGGFATNAEDAGFLKQLSLFYGRNKIICNLSLSAIILVTVLSLSFIEQLKDREQKALKAERKATDALNSYLAEQKKSKVLSDGIDTYQLLRQGNGHYTRFRLEQAKNFAKAVLLLEPESPNANELMGKVLCLEQNFSEAITFLEKSDGDIKKSLLPICQKYSGHSTPLSLKNLHEVIDDAPIRFKELKIKHPTHHYGWNRIGYDIVLFLTYAMNEHIPLEQCESLVEKLLKFENPEAQTSIKITKNSAGEYHLDASKCKNLNFIFTPSYLNIHSLDLGANVVKYKKPLFKREISDNKTLKRVTLSAENADLIDALKRNEIEVIIN